VIALLREDPSQPFNVFFVKLSIPRRSALGIQKPLALQESNLRNGDIGIVALEKRKYFAN
jgi:hypothetical protein